MEVKLHPYNALTCSVLICAFNAEATLREAIESARAQTLQDIEIIVVDDGSLDRTALIVVGQIALDRRVILLKQANGGVASARNRAVQAARGVAIAFLDADDRWEKYHLALHVEALATTDVEVTFARARFMTVRVDTPEGAALHAAAYARYPAVGQSLHDLLDDGDATERHPPGRPFRHVLEACRRPGMVDQGGGARLPYCRVGGLVRRIPHQPGRSEFGSPRDARRLPAGPSGRKDLRARRRRG